MSTLSKTTPKSLQCLPKVGPSLWLPLLDPIPYGTIDELFQEIVTYLKPRLELSSEEEYSVLAAQIMSTWIMELFNSCPYVFFYGPRGSGKTTGLDILKLLCYKAVMSSNMTHASIFRILHKHHPTLLLDETENYTAHNDEAAEIQRLLNAGYKRNNPIFRCHKDTFEPEAYDCFGPKAFAGTHELSLTLRDRCLTFPMARNINPIPPLIESDAYPLRAKLNQFRLDVISKRIDLLDLLDRHSDTVYNTLTNFLNITNGRCLELYSPLLITLGFLSRNQGQQGQLVNSEGQKVNSQKFEDIKTHAQNAYSDTNEELKNSIDAQVLNAIGRLNLNPDSRFRALSVAQALNNGKSLGEQTDPRTIGWSLSRLGFKPTRMQDGNKGWQFNQKLFERRLAQYGLEQTSPNETPVKTTSENLLRCIGFLEDIENSPPSQQLSEPSERRALIPAIAFKREAIPKITFNRGDK